MDATSTGTMMLVAALLAGVAIGLVAGYLVFPAIREAARLRMQLDQTLQDHETYRASVDTHFRKTADLVGQMTRSYAAVYDHLAGGARTFCDGGVAGDTIAFGPLPGALASPDIEAAAEPVATQTVAEPAGAEPAADPGQAESAATEATSRPGDAPLAEAIEEGAVPRAGTPG